MQSTVEGLLRQTGAAHGVYEENELNGVYDQDWAAWYAAWALENGLNDLLNAAWEQPALTARLIDLNEAHKQANTGENWAQFTARHLVEEA